MSAKCSQEPMEEDTAPPPAAAEPENVAEVVNTDAFQTRYHNLLENELENGSLTIDEYIELFLIEAVQNLEAARQTLFRGHNRHPKESLFTTLYSLLSFNSDDVGGALKYLRSVGNRLQKFQSYLTEIHNRIFAYGIASIVNCYTTIKIPSLMAMLGFGNEKEAAEFIEKLNWTVEDGAVKVSNTPELQLYVNSLVTPAHGSFNGFEKFKMFSHLGCRTEHPINNLKKLISVSDSLSKINFS